ncbi:acyltransferase [Sphingomonas sp. BK235]|jgi:peptidoglycan/LPS O-acetylase OafA/YrhL|uniref:acyltransferase family protein n=1 Tax=Sphingomonas sp. BK235 TaxID=2512131 RepID=UPI00105334AA|nr:acyltransferase [Sphingomonas sp. BK235]TCP33581.1 surface polysaccharide O-acyltransferase-like enzyme [Sphingomonas sp. BK235]
MSSTVATSPLPLDAAATEAETPPARRERLHYIQAARVVAIFLVVLSHTRFLFPPADAVWSPTMLLLLRSINLIFIFISGFLFQYLSATFHYRSYLKSKGRNVVLPYLFCSIPALFMFLSGIKHVSETGAPAFVDTAVEVLLFLLLTGSHLTPLWFIPVMVIFYLLSPVFLAIDRRPRLYLSLVPLLALSFYLSRSPGDVSPLHNAAFYLPVYLGGMCLSHYRERMMPPLARWYPLLALAIFLPLLFDMRGAGHEGVYLVSKMLFCLAVLGFLHRFVNGLPPLVSRLGDMSFGVFFVHQYVISALEKAQHKLPIPPLSGVVAFVVAALAVTVVSLAIVRVVQLVAGRRSRQLVGA